MTPSTSIDELHRESLVIFSHNHEMFPADLDLMRQGGIDAQFLSAFLDGRMFATPEAWEESKLSGEGFLSSALVTLDYLEWLCANPDNRVMLAREPSDIAAAKENGKIAIVLGAEGTKWLEGRLEVFRVMVRHGLRYVAPVWYYDNVYATSQESSRPTGLTERGITLVQEANRLGVIIDGNHMSERCLEETLEASSHPILVSHSGARALNPTQRQLLTDEHLTQVAKAGGVIGIMFQSLVVKPGHSPATKDDLMRQFDYCANLVGPEHIACGPDYHPNDPRVWQGNNPTGPMPEPISWALSENASQFKLVTQALLESGFNEQDVKMILGENLLRLFTKVREAATDGDPARFGDFQGHIPGTMTGGMNPL